MLSYLFSLFLVHVFPISSFSQSMWRTRPKLSFPKGCTSQRICHSIYYTHTNHFFHLYVPSTIIFVIFSISRPKLSFLKGCTSQKICRSICHVHTKSFFSSICAVHYIFCNFQYIPHQSFIFSTCIVHHNFCNVQYIPHQPLFFINMCRPL